MLTRWFCQQEIIQAIDSHTQIQLLLETETRFNAFDEVAWKQPTCDLRRSVPPEICDTIDAALPQAIAIRRRDFEADAMMTEIALRNGFQPALPPPWAPAQSMVRVLVIYDHESGAQMLAELRGEVASRHWSHRITLLDEPGQLAGADRVLVCPS